MAPIYEFNSNEAETIKSLRLGKRREDLEDKPVSNVSDWIYVPSINLEVARNKILHGENFYSTQKALHSNNQKMLTIPEFREFLKYTKANSKDVYDEITQVRNPWRAEWIDADFKVEGKDLIVYFHTFENGKIVRKSEKLDKNTLMRDKTPRISLESWLEDSTKQGLPKNVVKSGDLYYWAPDKDNNSVARFDADFGGAGLSCFRNPSGGNANLGVRAARKRLEQFS